MKEKKFVHYAILSVISLGLLTACDNNPSSSSQPNTHMSNTSHSNTSHSTGDLNNPTNHADEPIDISATLDDLTNPANVGIALPPEPTHEQAKVGLMGVDTNHNQVRDDIEHIIYQSVSLSDPPITANEYQQALDLIKYIQPNNDQTQSINEEEFYCKYIALSQKIRDEIDMSGFEYMVTDTAERHQAYRQKLIPSTSTQDIICQY